MIEITIDKEVFKLYTLCVGLLLGKTVLMSLVIAKVRFANRVSNIIYYLDLFSVNSKESLEYNKIYIV